MQGGGIVPPLDGDKRALHWNLPFVRSHSGHPIEIGPHTNFYKARSPQGQWDVSTQSLLSGSLDHNLGAQELKFLSKNPKPALRVSKLCKPPQVHPLGSKNGYLWVSHQRGISAQSIGSKRSYTKLYSCGSRLSLESCPHLANLQPASHLSFCL